MPKKVLTFPFSVRSKEMLSYFGRGPKVQDVYWLTADEAKFTGTLTYKNYERGRSSALLIFSDANGRRHAFFMTDANIIVPMMQSGKITGTFVPVKRGMNYGWSLEKHDR